MSNYQNWIRHTVTPRPTEPGAAWTYGFADFDRDGSADLIGMVYNPASQLPEVHTLSGASNFQQDIDDVATPLSAGSDSSNFTFQLADYDQDGIPDVLGIARYNTGTGNVELHALSGASNFQNWILHVGTVFGVTPIPSNFSFVVTTGAIAGQNGPIIPPVPTITDAGGSSSTSLWFLGENASSSIDGYNTTATLQIQSSPGDVIVWSTDSPAKLAVFPYSNGSSATISALAPSGFGAGYDVHVSVTRNGVRSGQFPVFVNTPFTMTTSGPSNYQSCGSGRHGYVTLVTHGIADLTGQVMRPIRTIESLENQKFYPADWQSVDKPAQGTWIPGVANRFDSSNRLMDCLFICSDDGRPEPQPPVTSYSDSGGTLLFNETQTFWVGSTQTFKGVCVQRGIASLYTNRGTVTNYTSPITDKSLFAQGQVIN